MIGYFPAASYGYSPIFLSLKHLCGSPETEKKKSTVTYLTLLCQSKICLSPPWFKMHTCDAPLTSQNLEAPCYTLHKHFLCFKHSSLLRVNEWAPSEVSGGAHRLHRTCLVRADRSLLKGGPCSFFFSWTWEKTPWRRREREKWGPVWREP